jgi:hypothetical protein
MPSLVYAIHYAIHVLEALEQFDGAPEGTN